MPIRLSALERSHLLSGQCPSEAIRATVDFAGHLDRLGYHRIWLAEHHSTPGIPGCAPTVLAAHIAAVTSRIRVGTGGVMLPNHRPLVVAEQIGVLTALHGDRIDLGIGKTLGATPQLRAALGTDEHSAEDFEAQLSELFGYFTRRNAHSGVRAALAEEQVPPVFLLSMGGGPEIAASFGLPLVVAPVRGIDPMIATIDRYREKFRPSEWAPEPYVVVSESIGVADSAEQALQILVPEAAANARAAVEGGYPELPSPDDVRVAEMNDAEREAFDRALDVQIFGTAEQVADELGDLVKRTAADEILVITPGFDQQERLESHRRLAELAARM